MTRRYRLVLINENQVCRPTRLLVCVKVIGNGNEQLIGDALSY